MFPFKNLLRKLTRKPVLADMGQPFVPQGQVPQPYQGGQAAVQAPPMQQGMGTAFKGRIEEAIISEMMAYLKKANSLGWDDEEVMFNMNPLWKNRYIHLWEQALQQFQSQVPPPQQPGVPGQASPGAVKMQYKDLDPNVLRQKIEPHIRETGKLLTPEELPAVIRENERNLENYFDIGSRILRDMEDEQSSQKSKSPNSASPEVAFQNKFAQVFYQMYLANGTENAEKYHLMFQGTVHDRFGPQNASDIAAIDDLFNKRIPEGHSGGKTYDPIVGYFVSDYGKQNAGMFIKAFKKRMGEDFKIDRPSLAKFIAKHMDKAEQKFEELMYLQDESVAKYVAEKTRMKGEGAARSGAMIDQETGGVRDMADSQNYSAGNRDAEDKPVNQIATNALRQGLLDIPNHVASLGSQLAQKIRENAASKSSVKKQNSERTALLIEAYTSAMQQSLMDMYKKLEEGKLPHETLDKMIQQNLVQVETDQGVVRIKPNAAKHQGDILKHLEFDEIVQPSKIVGIFAKNLAKTNPEMASQMLGRAGQPIDLSMLDEQSPNFNKAEFDAAKKRIYMMPQFLLREVGPELLSLLREGKADPSTAIALTKMLKPHGQSDKMGRLMSLNEPLDEARDWVSKYLREPKKIWVKDPQTGKLAKDPQTGEKIQDFQRDEQGNIVYNNNNSWLSQALDEDPHFPKIDRNSLRTMTDDQFKAWLAKAAKRLYAAPGYQDPSKQQTAYYFAQLLDWGKKQYPEFAQHDQVMRQAHRILSDAIFKMAEMLELRRSLSKYSSVGHIDEMLSKTVSEAIVRIDALWMK